MKLNLKAALDTLRRALASPDENQSESIPVSSVRRQIKKPNLSKDLATCQLSKLISLPRRSNHPCGLWSFVLAATCLTVASRGTPALEAPQEPGAEKAAQAHYLNTQPGVEYVGDQVCGSCHSVEYRTFKQTAMGRSTSIPSQDDLQSLVKPVTFSSSTLDRTYSVYSRNGKMYHEESQRDAKGQLVFSETHEIAYIVGAGEVGKSYLVGQGDAFFVSPISFYTRINGWDLSPGYETSSFRDFTRPVLELCVDCHTGQPSFVPDRTNHFQHPPFRFLSIGCERCHGPGAIHVKQRRQGAPLEGPVDYSIVNPAEMPAEIRDDVCAQCHFLGDARVLRPGKNSLDFRPGTPLDKVVAIFSVPASVKRDRFTALDQFEQLKLSRCAIASKGRLGCITCHDPHVQLRGAEAAQDFRERCVTCHKVDSCRAPSARRQSTSPPDSCVACHMPKQQLQNISHASATDHRILRDPSENLQARDQALPVSSEELVYDSRPLGFEDAKPDLRSLALAYPQVAGKYPILRQKGLAALQEAARELRDDAEVQATYGLILAVAQPGEEAHAAEVLQRAIDLGSRSPEVRSKLGDLRLQQGQVVAAIALYKESIQIEPFYRPAYLDLARAYLTLNDLDKAYEILDRLLKIDPGNDAARQGWLKLRPPPDEHP
jgi:tetratricopeptide (TPR) repeat protein